MLGSRKFSGPFSDLKLLRQLVRIALALPPHVAARKALRLAVRKANGVVQTAMAHRRCAFADPSELPGPLRNRLKTLRLPDLSVHASPLAREAGNYRQRRFDLLGSGPVTVAHGTRYRGFGPWHYGPGPALPDTGWHDRVVAELPGGSRERARAILDLIADDSYRPIDWQVDFRSGYRWQPTVWGPACSYGHRPGVDIKVPWELGRLQHLPRLALAHAAKPDPAWPGTFRNQALDFLASNPPGWGVNWACAMDVAIRAANLALAWDLFITQGASFDAPFEAELAAGLLAHGRFIVEHLEWHPRHRANHYLADIAGLAFIAAYLPRTPEADGWLVFAMNALSHEIERQFGTDGAGFEASVAYHGLSAELALFAAALILGLADDEHPNPTALPPGHWRGKVPFPSATDPWTAVSESLLARLAGMARFADDATKPSGRFVQIGDNDSGHFFTLGVRPEPDGTMTPARQLDPAPAIAAAQGLFAFDDLIPEADAVETALTAALAGGWRQTAPPRRAAPVIKVVLPEETAEHALQLRILPPDPAALSELQVRAYPDFGLFIWKNGRSFVSIFCGPIGQNGNGGHAHNDALSVEIEIDGIPFARDPGSFVYTADLEARNAWRSVMAHFAPRRGKTEPAGRPAPFQLENRARPEILAFSPAGFLGRHHGFRKPVYRRLAFERNALIIEDLWGGPEISRTTRLETHTLETPEDLAALWGFTVPFSPSYGKLETPWRDLP